MSRTGDGAAPDLVPAPGRGGATTFQQDRANADCILIQGSNMAECHPVGFQWVMEAKARGATVIHVDPRFTRTSAVADLHVPIRAGADIAFLRRVFDLLPGYLPMPHAHTNEDLDTYVEAERTEKGFWGNMRACTVSLLTAWWGDAATAENDFCRPRCRSGRRTGAGRRGLRGARARRRSRSTGR